MNTLLNTDAEAAGRGRGNTLLDPDLQAAGHSPGSHHRPALVVLSAPSDPHWSPVVIRLATERDRRALERLAQLDSARPPADEVLLGEVLGRPVAALSLRDGDVIADPFLPTSHIVELLRLRASQLASRRPPLRGAGPIHRH
jgi:hypothetical protein